jgi:hypothetical protein
MPSQSNPGVVVVLASDGSEPLELGPFQEVQVDDCSIFDVVAGHSIAEWSYGDGPDGYVVQPPYTGALDGVYSRALLRVADHG